MQANLDHSLFFPTPVILGERCSRGGGGWLALHREKLWTSGILRYDVPLANPTQRCSAASGAACCMFSRSCPSRKGD